MEREIDDIIKECREFIQLKKQCKQSRNADAGTPAYLVSKAWLQKYKKYIYYQEIKRNMKPLLSNDHCQQTHPGPMTNEEDFCDLSDTNLKGTGKGEFENSTVDKYLRADAREGF